MEHHQDSDNGWVEDAQNWICQINSVKQCKIDLDNYGEVTAVHIVSTMDREPRHIVRDVEALFKARLGLDIYYKKIGVVQILDGEHQAVENTPEPDPSVSDSNESYTEPTKPEQHEGKAIAKSYPSRIMCNSVSVVAKDNSLTVEVKLSRSDTSFTGTCRGLNESGKDLSLVAEATVKALNNLLDENAELSLAEIREITSSGEDILLVAVELVTQRKSEKLFGTCAVQRNVHQSVIYSVLDAVNRRLSAVLESETVG